MLHRYFNKTICLTQESRPDRWQQFTKECQRIGLYSERFYSVPNENRFISFCDSQIAMLKHCYDCQDKTILTFEDDVVFKPFHHFEEAMQELSQWDILYLGANVHKCEPHTKNTRKVTSAWTTHAVAYHRDVINIIVNEYKGWEQDGMYDDWLSRKILPQVNAYVIAPMIAWQRPVHSDLWGREVSYGWPEIETRLI